MTSTDNSTILDQYLARTKQSADLATRARDALPGGIVTDTRHFEPYGIYVNRAAGARKWDVDGNEYLDFFGGHGANMLGHAPRIIVEAVTEAIRNGVQFAANQPLEVELAAEVKRLMPNIHRLRFTGSGTEATLLAIRLARAFTGRKKIVRFTSHYHGWHDHAASGYLDHFDGSAAPGVLPEVAEQTLLVRPGDMQTLQLVTQQHAGDIAAYLIEPVGSHFGVVPVASAFLHAVQEAARSIDALFILDEVLSGFRIALGGAQSIYGLRPDLTTLGKILCGGMPGGAVGGRTDILDLLDHRSSRRGNRPKVLHQGTFTGNPASMAAGLAMLREMQRVDACNFVNQLGAFARETLNARCASAQLPFRWYGEFSAFHLLPLVDTHERTSDTDLMQLPLERFLARPQPLLNRLRMALNVLGIDVNTKCSGLLGVAHTEGQLLQLADAIVAAGAKLRREGHLAE